MLKFHISLLSEVHPQDALRGNQVKVLSDPVTVNGELCARVHCMSATYEKARVAMIRKSGNLLMRYKVAASEQSFPLVHQIWKSRTSIHSAGNLREGIFASFNGRVEYFEYENAG